MYRYMFKLSRSAMDEENDRPQF